jgi:Na+-translocating ferredoxin:NAD+ oxidoreductase RnfG subunit
MGAMLSRNAITEGYNGNITVSAVVNGQGTIAYLTVDASCETAGLGQKVMETEYLVQFLGKTLPLTLGTDVDAVAGATITSQAVVDALNLLTPDYGNTHSAPVITQRSVTKEIAHVQTIKGHDSTMRVVVYTTPNGTVTNVNVYADGESCGQAVMSNTFTNQFVGYNSEVILGEDVDAVAGATATSQAVVDAVNNIIR